MSTNSTAPLLLCVEDEIFILDLLASELEDAGFRVIPAGRGAQALELLADRADGINGVITDINLGQGASGWDVGRRARELVSHMPVIYVTAANEEEWASQGVPKSVLIAKPYVAAQVIVAISSLLNVSET